MDLFSRWKVTEVGELVLVAGQYETVNIEPRWTAAKYARVELGFGVCPQPVALRMQVGSRPGPHRPTVSLGLDSRCYPSH